MKLLKLFLTVTLFTFTSSAYSALSPLVLKTKDSGGSIFKTRSSSNPGTSDYLTIHALKMHALERAISNCKEAGMRLCVLKSVILSSKRRNIIIADAIVHSIDHYSSSLQGGDLYKEKIRWHSTKNDTNRLETLGVKLMALEKAIATCHTGGHDFCAIESIHFLSLNDSGIEAEALVTGYSLH